MKRSHRELSIDMVIHRGIFKIKQVTRFHCFTLIPISFYCVVLLLLQVLLHMEKWLI